MASVWCMVREKKVAVERIGKKVNGDMARSATACGMTGLCAMTCAPKADGDGRQE